MGKNVIITGGSGMIGGLALEHCLPDPEVSRVTSLVRRASGIKHEKLDEITINDFLFVKRRRRRPQRKESFGVCKG